MVGIGAGGGTFLGMLRRIPIVHPERGRWSVRRTGAAVLGVVFLAAVGLVSGLANAADFRDVPRVTVQDAAFFRARLEAARTGVVRIAMFGDSQETAPWGWGEHYIAHLNARFATVYGPAGESHLFTNHTSIARPYWLATMEESTARVDSAIGPTRVLPSMTVHALRAPAAAASPADGWARTVFLHDASRAASAELAQPLWFDQQGPFAADVLVIERPGGAGLLWRNAPTDLDVPDRGAPVVQNGVFPADPKLQTDRVSWRSTPPLDFAARRHVQLALAGDSSKRSVEVVGVRFRSTTAHRGVVLQSFARGGMRLPDLTAEHGASGGVLRALSPSIAVLHYGANDVGQLASLEAWRAQLQVTIAWIRAELEDPTFPIIIVAEQRCIAGIATMALLDALPTVAHELALADPRILALNLRRVTFEEYGWGGSTRYLADSAHFLPYAQRMQAQAFVGELTRALGIADPACAQGNWADCVRVWGASCQQGGCRMEPDFEVAEHGLPWQGAGTDCSDGNGDGFSDECPPGGREDFNFDGFVDAADLAVLLGAWGTADVRTDLDASGAVDAPDLAMFLSRWGS
jgi:hypothetical protein